VTLLLKGPNRHTVEQIKDAIHDGIRSVFNVLKDRRSSGYCDALCSTRLIGCLGSVVPGAGAFELAAHVMLKKAEDEVKGRAKLGIKVSS